MSYLISFNWSQLLQPMFYIEQGGIWLILLVIFAETGLFIGFFLPGDSLLFVTGIYANEIMLELFKKFNGIVPNEYFNLFILILLISIAGILGNFVGYSFGKKVGVKMYEWKDSTFFKQKYLEQARLFYEKYGVRAIVAGRFLPFVRTFAPIVAGIVRMPKKIFTFFNIVGSLGWVSSMILSGFFIHQWLKKSFQIDLTKKLELIVLVIVLITTLPVIYKFVKNKKSKS